MCEESRKGAVAVAASYGLDKLLTRLLAERPKQFDLYQIALESAIGGGCEKTVELLLEFNPEFFSNAEVADATLRQAVRNGQGRIVKMLLARNPKLKVDGVHQYGGTLLHSAAEYTDDAELVAQLLAHSPSLIDKLPPSKYHEAPLHIAAQKGHCAIVAELLARKPELSSAVNFHKETPLGLAIERGQGKVVAQLLAHDPKLIDSIDSSVLKSAVGRSVLDGGYVGVMAQLLAHKPELIECEGRSLLKRALSDSHISLVDLLLVLKPELVREVDSAGCTVLHRLMEFSYPPKDFIKRVFLMCPGAVRHLNHAQESPFHRAIRCDMKWAEDLFLPHTPVDQASKEYCTKRIGDPSRMVALQRVWALLREHCEGLLEELLPPPGLVWVVFDYVSILSTPETRRKRGREGEQTSQEHPSKK